MHRLWALCLVALLAYGLTVGCSRAAIYACPPRRSMSLQPDDYDRLNPVVHRSARVVERPSMRLPPGLWYQYHYVCACGETAPLGELWRDHNYITGRWAVQWADSIAVEWLTGNYQKKGSA